MSIVREATPELRVLCAAAMREIILELGDAYAADTGVKVAGEFTRSALVHDRVRAGEAVDIVITTQSLIADLARENVVVPGSAAALARSGIGVAVRAGRRRPDIGSLDGFVAALRAANSIACADPAFGTPSGLYLSELFDRLGLTAELKTKLRLIGATGGRPVLVCAPVAAGEAELGIQQIPEIVAVPGVDFVGPLPPEIQHTTVFVVAVGTATSNSILAHDFVAFLGANASRSVISAHGMELVRAENSDLSADCRGVVSRLHPARDCGLGTRWPELSAGRKRRRSCLDFARNALRQSKASRRE